MGVEKLMLFTNSKEDKSKDFLVIGAGRFGSSIAKTLSEIGKEVLLLDLNSDKLQSLKDEVTHTVIADATDENCLKVLEVNSFDAAIVAIGSNLTASILITLQLKEMGVKKVICKAVTELQAKILYKLGASQVIFPERDTGIRVAHNLVSANLIDIIEIDPKYSLFETRVPDKWINKSIIDIDMRNKYGLNLLAIKKDDNVDVTPMPTQILNEGDLMILLGEKSSLKKIID